MPMRGVMPEQRDASGSLEIRQATSLRQWSPFVVAGSVSILAGGFCAAIDGAVPSQHLAWASAYLVLVCGSAQIVLGGSQALFKVARSSARLAIYEFVAFNIANAAVLVGTLLRFAIVLDVGSVLFLVSPGLFAWAAKGTVTRHRSVTSLYRGAILVLAVSVPVGVLLAR
jgi:hypothetical protein